MTENIKKFAIRAAAPITALVAFGSAAIAHAAYDPADLAAVSASTTAGITDARDATLSLFYQNLPTIVLGILAVALTLWGVFLIINRITRHK